MAHILIGDVHPVFVYALKEIFGATDDLVVSGVASNADELIAKVVLVKVDLLLLDSTISGANGTDLIKQVHALIPDLPILMLSMNKEAHFVMKALRAGASGYISKDTEIAAMLDGIRKVAKGGRYVSPSLTEALTFEAVDAKFDPRDLLSPREFQILTLLVGGAPITKIAQQLYISPKTVSAHKRNLMQKLGISDNANLFKFAIANDLAR